MDEQQPRGERWNCTIDNLLEYYAKKGSSFNQYSSNNLMGKVVKGGADTTSGQLLTLVLAFVLRLNVQERQRQKIEACYSADRSSTWSVWAAIP